MARPEAIVSLQEAPTEGTRNWLFYAPSGEGKTVLSGTAPKCLFLTVEAAGTESAKALGSDADEWVINSWAEFQKAIKWVKKEGYKQYEWLCVDSITEMEELCWNDQLESIKKEFEARIQDYGIVDRKIKKTLDQLNRLPINVIYTAQQAAMEMEDEDGDEFYKVLPKLGREKGGWPLANLICGKVTLIGLLKVMETDDGPVRRLYVQGGERWTAKDRHDTFGKFIENPNVAEMALAVDARQAGGSKLSGTVATTSKKKKKEKV